MGENTAATGNHTVHWLRWRMVNMDKKIENVLRKKSNMQRWNNIASHWVLAPQTHSQNPNTPFIRKRNYMVLMKTIQFNFYCVHQMYMVWSVCITMFRPFARYSNVNSQQSCLKSIQFYPFLTLYAHWISNFCWNKGNQTSNKEWKMKIKKTLPKKKREDWSERKERFERLSSQQRRQPYDMTFLWCVVSDGVSIWI